MIFLQSTLPTTSDSSRILLHLSPSLCPCKLDHGLPLNPRIFPIRKFHKNSRPRRLLRACMLPTDGGNHNVSIEIPNSARRGAKFYVVKRFADELDGNGKLQLPQDSIHLGMGSNFTSFQEDPIVDKLRTQLGVIHPLPSPPINRTIVGLFVFFFFVGVASDKLWTSRKRNKFGGDGRPVLIRDEPLSVRNVERELRYRVNDLQYQIGLRYTGGARMLLMLSLNFSIIPIAVPVGVRDFDIDGELWVKLRLIPSEPWVGAVSWAFVSLPKIKFELSPFRLFNLMAIPVLSMFLKKLLTEDLPRLFVRPKKIVLDFQKGKAVGPVPNDLKSGGMQEGNKDFVGEAVGPLPNEFKSGGMQEGNKDFVGELSVTLVDARKLSYIFFGKTDPYVVLSLGDQVIRSKKNSQTTVIGPPGEPIWNQDFHMLVANPRKQKLQIQVKDSLGFTDLTIGTGEVDLGPLKDTVPTDRIVVLRGGWGLFRKGSSGEILLRLTYKAYVEDEEDERTEAESLDTDASDDELFDSDEADGTYKQRIRASSDGVDKESLMDVLAALIVSEEFQGIVASETGTTKFSDDAKSTLSTRLSPRGVNDESSPSNPDNASEGSGGSALAWLAVITIQIFGLATFSLCIS
ncbi:Extended synaptotagmin-1 [Camellia lanceoleosa]|uniref:Extended synaptotagmin-1 n=1 Tax=Camellia lanceoleosa TaxID=1840588 RepID=A0ACC0G5Q6_9ERIC|nr:Extended synaptotagmin-1 [Camellia lanceoleosa]